MRSNIPSMPPKNEKGKFTSVKTIYQMDMHSGLSLPLARVRKDGLKAHEWPGFKRTLSEQIKARKPVTPAASEAQIISEGNRAKPGSSHIFVSFLSYCLQVTLKQRAKTKAPGLTPRAILEKFKTMQMIDVHLSDHRWAQSGPAALHPARKRSTAPFASTQPDPAGPAASTP